MTSLELRWQRALFAAIIPGAPWGRLPPLRAVELDGFWPRFQRAAPFLVRFGFRFSVVVLTLLPLVGGIKPIDGGAYALLIAGYALTGFAEETMFRGVLVRLLEKRSPMMIAIITSILFGLVHLSNIFIRGNVAVIAAQAVGAAAFGFGYVAIRQRTNTLVPLLVTHMLTDLFLQMGNLPLIPVAVVQDLILFGAGLYLLRGWPPPSTSR